MSEYRVNLDIYNGPLDLLLYLIRRDEVDIYDIPVARITQQYVSYVDLLQQLDPNLAGDFLVMAATLLEIKTRMLLPTPPPEEGGDAEGLAFDPRAELVRQLLEYKAFKDAAEDLREAQDLRSMRFARAVPAPLQDPGNEVELEDVQVWDLLDAFQNILVAIGQDARIHEVIYDDTPVELHVADILDRLGREGALSFRKIFEGRTTRVEIVGLFLAMLELIRRRQIVASQGDNFGQIDVRLNPNPPQADQIEAEARADAQMDQALLNQQKAQPAEPADQEPADEDLPAITDLPQGADDAQPRADASSDGD
jgi:segregation and condensation protein A